MYLRIYFSYQISELNIYFLFNKSNRQLLGLLVVELNSFIDIFACDSCQNVLASNNWRHDMEIGNGIPTNR